MCIIVQAKYTLCPTQQIVLGTIIDKKKLPTYTPTIPIVI